MLPKRFLFISHNGLSCDLAWRVKLEGHEVLYYIEDGPRCELGDGFITKTKDWRRYVDWADILIFDDVMGHGQEAAPLRAAGHAVIGGTPYTDRLEDDKPFGQRELEKVGVKILPFYEFDNAFQAAKFVRDHRGRYVLKPNSVFQNVKSLVYVGQEPDGEDLLLMLRHFESLPNGGGNLQLQVFAAGIELAVGAFFNGRRFLRPININFEHKRLFPGELGPMTGEMGTAMFWRESFPLFDRTLGKMEEHLRAENYRGYIDLNCIVTKKEIWPLEFSTRFGYPTIFIQQEAIRTPIGEFLAALASGDEIDLEVRTSFQVGIRVCIPPYPLAGRVTFPGYARGTPIIFRKKNVEGVHFEDAKLVNGTEWQVAGIDGVPLTVVGLGESMKAAKEQALSRIQQIYIPEMYYRSDIGDRWEHDVLQLQAWGYL